MQADAGAVRELFRNSAQATVRQSAKKVLVLIGDETLPEAPPAGRGRSSSTAALPPPQPEVDLLDGFREEGGDAGVTQTGAPSDQDTADMIGMLCTSSSKL